MSSPPFHLTRLLVVCSLLFSLSVNAAGPRDNPLLKPPLPELPDLYGEEKTAEPEPKTDTFEPPPLTEPQPQKTVRQAPRRQNPGKPTPASKAMRAELQRQIAQFHQLSGDPDRALSQLLAAESRGWLKLNGNKAALQAARLLDDLELPAEAERLYATLPEWQTPQDERQAFMLSRVQSHYNRGEYRASLSLLKKLGTPSNQGISNQAESLRIRALMALEQFTQVNNLYKEQLGRPTNNLYNRFNLGVSMVAGGQTAIGIGQLDELGEIAGLDAEPLAIRDQANLSLGWAFLQAGQGGTARPFFRRVRIDGPASSRALLGLGWALLAPDGEPQEKILIRLQNCIEDPAQILQSTTAVMRRPARDACGKPKLFKYRRELAFEKGSKAPQKRLQAALKPWSKLLERPTHDIAVQEALVARGYAFGELRQSQAAAQAYREAVMRLEEERKRMNNIKQRLQSKPLQALISSDADVQIYLGDYLNNPMTMESRSALSALQRYATRLDKAAARLQKLKQSGATPDTAAALAQLGNRQRSLLLSFESVIRRQIDEQFAQREQQLGSYLKRARLALASQHTQQP